MILALILIGLVIVTAAFAFLATKAPIGYQDNEGFHFGWQGQTAPPPEDANVTPFWRQISWTKPALGLGALALVLLTATLQPNPNSTQVQAPRQQLATTASKTSPHENAAFVGPSAQLFPTFCQRDTEVR